MIRHGGIQCSVVGCSRDALPGSPWCARHADEDLRPRVGPTPAEARTEARQAIPRSCFRGEPVYDLHAVAAVAADCTTYDSSTPRLWGPRTR